MDIEKKIIINADVKQVWNKFCQLEKWPEWGGYIFETKWISGKKWAKGSRFSQTVKGFWLIKKFESSPKILEVKPFKLVRWAGTRRLVKGTHIFMFEKIGSKTRVLNIEHFSGILAPFAFPLLKANFNIYFQQFLEGLKKESERRIQQPL